MTARTLLAAALLLLAVRTVAAQDRPLLERFRIGYPQTASIAQQLRAAASLERALRRKGYLVAWQDFDSGIAALRALDAEEVDIALDLSLQDVVAAKREGLRMVFIAELRSIAPSCCDLEQMFADHTFKRYTLSSEYFADQREDVLLIVHQEIIRVLRQPERLAAEQADLEPDPVALIERRNSQKSVAPVTRSTIQDLQSAIAAASPDRASTLTDLTDSNYWLPQ